MKTYEVFDQRFPLKGERGWVSNLVPVGTIEARDVDHALRVAKSRARFPVVYNREDFAAALYEQKMAAKAEQREAALEIP